MNMRLPAWMIFLGATATLCVTAGIGLVVISSRNQHVLVGQDYYREGLRLDIHRAREAAFDSLGWNLTFRRDGKWLVVEAERARLETRAIAGGLAGLSLVLQLRRPDDAAADLDAPLTLTSQDPPSWAGRYELRPGHWNARAVFSDSSGPRFERSLTLAETP
jgi:hypothetical protein